MKRAFALVALLAVLGFTFAGCGTNTGPTGEAGRGGPAGNTGGQDTTDQPEAGGLRTPAYTAANNVCSLLPLTELARQNNVKATPEAVAKIVASGETNPKARAEAKKGCLDALKTEGG
jgi:hypothetical protein